MASAPDSAILNFPSGTDIYSTKVDRFAVISGESHTIPAGSPFTFFLGHLPLQESPSNISIPGYVEVSGSPANFQYNVTYSGTSAGLLTFNSLQASNVVAVTYKSAGDISKAEFINSLQTSVVNIENYVLTNAATSGVVHTSGGTMTGNLTMNGASVVTSVSGGNSVGQAGTPFSTVYANSFVGTSLIADANNSLQFANNELVQQADVIRLQGGTDIFLTTSGSTIYLFADTISVSGSMIPTFSGFYDLGASGNHWKTLYVDNIVTPNGSGTFVQVSGDTMTGNLTMAPGVGVVTDNVTTNTGALSLDGNTVNVTSVGDTNIVAGGAVNLSNTVTVAPFAVTTNATVTPTISSTYDLGASGSSFRNIYVDNIIGGTLSGSFVRTSGDTMTGDLTIQPPATLNVATINAVLASGIAMNAPQINLNADTNIRFSVALNQMLEIGATQIYQNASIIPAISGTYDLGEPVRPLASVFADNLHAKVVSGSSILNAVFSGTVTLASGASIVPEVSGSATLGSPSSYFGAIYADTIVTAGTSGVFVSRFGDTMTGNLTLASGASLLVSLSGVSNIGTASNPFGTVYANHFTLASGNGGLFVLRTGDTMTGPLLLNDLSTPSGTLALTGNVDITLDAQQIDITSSSGPIIIDANTELQLAQNGSMAISINPSGITYFESFFPDVSGTLTIGTPQKPFSAIYANNVFTPGGGGTFVSRLGDTMVGDLTMVSGSSVLTAVSGTGNIGSATNPFNAIYANNIIGVSPSGNFVLKTGDSMTGNLLMVGNATVQTANISGTSATSGLSIVSTSGSATSNVNLSYSGAGIVSTIGINNASIAIGSSSIGQPTVNLISHTGGGGSTFRQTIDSAEVQFSGGTAIFRVDVNNSRLFINNQGLDFSTAVGNRIFVTNNATSGTIVAGNFTTNASGTYNIGNTTFPFSGIYGRSAFVNNIFPLATGGSVNISGASFSSPIVFSPSGAVNVGSANFPANNIYANQLIQPIKTVSNNYVVVSGDAHIFTNHSSAITISLPLFEEGYKMVFKDQSGLANNTTRLVTVSGVSCTLDGQPNYFIDTNYGRATFVVHSGAWYRIA